VDRNAWFCPNCKRSVPRGGRGDLRSGWLLVCGAVAVSFAIGAVVTSHLRSSAPPEPAEISVREIPLVHIAPGVETKLPEAPAAVERPKREKTDRRDKREARRERRNHSEETDAGADQVASGEGAVDVQTDSSAKTYVYLNGGTLLGEAPLKNVSLPAGKHTLTFWSPSVGGRSRRTVDVQPGQSVSVKESVKPQDGFKDESAPAPSTDRPGSDSDKTSNQ
jgi:hypothetical protein